MWTFKKGSEARGLDDFWYALTEGGYIVPGDLLELEEDVRRLKEAIATVKSFERAAIEAGILEQI
jgi:hypothetical protein